MAKPAAKQPRQRATSGPVQQRRNSRDIADLLRRSDTQERNLGDLARSQTSTVEMVGRIEARVGLLEEINTQRAIIAAREDERDKALNKRLDDIENDIKTNAETASKGIAGIRADINRVLWAVFIAFLGAVAVAIVAWIVSGGMRPIP